MCLFVKIVSKMKIILLVLLLAAAVSADTSKWLDFRVKYAVLPFFTKSYIEIYQNIWQAEANGWVRVTTTNRLGLTTLCYSQRDNRVCPIYDTNGIIAGMLLAIPEGDVEGHGIPYDFSTFPVYEKKTINDQIYWTSTYYLVNPSTLANGGRTSSPTLGDGLWFQQTDGYKEIPTDLSSIERTTPYTKQNCIPQMGVHYYYNVTKNSDCHDFQPFFLLVKHGNVIGLGWQFFGKTTPVDVNWYDDINALAAKATVPNGPQCMIDNTNQFGVISVHMYFVQNPWFICCWWWDNVNPFWFFQ